MINGVPNVQGLTQYGQTVDNESLLMTVFGWLIENNVPYISDLSDRAVNLLIEEYRYQYGE